MGRTWDAVIDQFAARNIPIRTIERASGLIVTDDLTVGREGYWWADCGKTSGWGNGSEKPPLPVGVTDTTETNPNHLGPTRATYNVLVRGDSVHSTVKATVRWTHISEKAIVRECTTNHSWERELENQVKLAAEGRASITDVEHRPTHPAAEGTRSPNQSSAAPTGDIPAGINWIADRRTKMYYQVGCPASNTIASEDRVYFVTEASALVAGFSPSGKC